MLDKITTGTHYVMFYIILNNFWITLFSFKSWLFQGWLNQLTVQQRQ